MRQTTYFDLLLYAPFSYAKRTIFDDLRAKAAKFVAGLLFDHCGTFGVTVAAHIVREVRDREYRNGYRRRSYSVYMWEEN